jgi:enterochelin esterase-like enzyme
VVSRRAFLVGVAAAGGSVIALGAGAYALVEAEVLPGKYRMAELLGACGDGPTIPDVEPGPVVSGRFTSAARRGGEVGWSVVYPPGSVQGASLPVCLTFPGRGGHHTDAVDALHLDRHLAAAVLEQGVAPFALVALDSGDAVNWHRRADGDDPETMLTDELLPLLDAMGLATAAPALWGWSLGGTGALYLASTDLRPWVGAVASSPALWNRPGKWQPGTYDDDIDWERTSPWHRTPQLEGMPLRIDCGEDDPLVDDVRAFRDALDPTPAGGIEPGCHDSAFWMRMAPAQIAFLGEALSGR